MSKQYSFSLSYKIIAITFAGLLVIFSMIAAVSWLNATHLFHQTRQSIDTTLHDELTHTEKTVRGILQRKGTSLVEFLAEISAVEIISFDHQALHSFLDNIIKDEDVVYALYHIEKDNLSIGKHRPLLSSPWSHEHQDNEDMSKIRQKMLQAGHVIEFSKDITFYDKKVGTVTVAISQENLLALRQKSLDHLAATDSFLQEEIHRFLAKLNFSLLLVYAIACILLGGFLYLTIRQIIIKKLQALSHTFSQVSGGDLSKKIELDCSDEIGDLCRAFNNMTSSLQKITLSRDTLEENHKILQRMQDELAKSHHDLEVSHEFTRKLIQHSPVGIMIIVDFEKIIDINIAGKKILGLKEEAIIGKRFQDFFLSAEKDCTIHCKDMEVLVQTEQTCRTSDARTIPVLMNCIQLKNESDEDLVLTTFVDISARKKAEDTLRKISITDELTGLFNRRGFLSMADKQLKIADRSKNDLFLMYADLDNMKGINDQLGHQAGDQALIETADIFRNTFRKSDIFGRLGGDEFAVLFTAENEEEDSSTIKQRLADQLQRLNNQPNRTFSLSISTGIVRFKHSQQVSLEQLMLQADQLMYQTKMNKHGEKK